MNQIQRSWKNDETPEEPRFCSDAGPAWYGELASNLAIRSQFVLSGNIRDQYRAPRGAGHGFVDFEQAIWQIVRRQGIPALLVYDLIDGLRLHKGCDKRLEKFLVSHGIRMGEVANSPEELAEIHRQISGLRTIPTALIVDYGSHLGQIGSEKLENLFVSVHKDAHRPLNPRSEKAGRAPDRNPTFWLVDRPGDLPGWFVVRNDTLCEVLVEYPTLEDRYGYAKSLMQTFPEAHAAKTPELQRFREQFALECEGETLVAMRSIAQLARAEGIGLPQLSDAIAAYRTGARRNPWKSPVLKSRMRNAGEILRERIKGQDAAIITCLDILTRSITGLSGAQTSRRHARPRGVLFFAGPTGVGKTELAKSVTELLFGDETFCHRFDMSEFMEEQSITRLIGAPPGHPGHELGGELINAVHKRPFSVFLFDEIEKAHPRILDTFLQILDEGRLTDSRGATAHFSEALIIFTSNIGMLDGNRADNMGMSVLPSDPHEVVERKIVRAVQDHFRFELKRPELMNRIGQNVVVFDFIKRSGQYEIFTAILRRVVNAVAAEQGIAVSFTPEVLQELKYLCTHDVNDGGRGIGNRVEKHLVNPLAREIFFCEDVKTLLVEGLSTERGQTQLKVVAGK